MILQQRRIFYSNVMNLPIEKEGDDEVILKTEDSLFYIIKHSNRTGPVLEFLDYWCLWTMRVQLYM